jgi:hypothetical protein
LIGSAPQAGQWSSVLGALGAAPATPTFGAAPPAAGAAPGQGGWSTPPEGSAPTWTPMPGKSPNLNRKMNAKANGYSKG